MVGGKYANHAGRGGVQRFTKITEDKEHMMNLTTREIARKIAAAADSKKARDVLMLDLREISAMTDYFIIAGAPNNVLVKAIADNIEDELSKLGLEPRGKEGYAEGRWVLLDYGDCVAHIFLEEERDFYNLEELWADAPAEAVTESEDE
jgi:ribosome-associated protein